MSLRIAIVIPAYNEETAIADTVLEYKAAFPEATIAVIDNNSRDRTSEAAKLVLTPGQDLLLREHRQGKGMAIKRGLSRCDADIYIMTDADCTYPAEDARKLLEIMLRERADMIVGDRVSGGAYGRQNKRLGHGLGNYMLTAVISGLAGQRFRDVLSGLRVMSRPFVANLDVRSSGFQLETEMNIIAAHLRADIIEEPIEYRARAAGSVSKLNTLRDGVRILGFALTSWVAFLPMEALARVAGLMFLIAGVLGVRVFLGYAASNFTEIVYPTSAVIGAAAGSLGVQALFTGLTLRVLGRGARRREIADFIEARRAWNAHLDEALVDPVRERSERPAAVSA